MEYIKPLIQLILGLELLEKCSGFPADLTSSVRRGGAGIVGVGVGVGIATPQVLGVALLAAAVALLLGCACCGRRKGFRELNKSVLSSQESVRRSGGSGSGSGGGPSLNTTPSEFTMFPPVGVSGLSCDRSSVVHFEPLPDIRPPTPPQPLRKPPVFHNHRLSPEDWFLNGQADFPRNQLQYLREVGRGWFGRVVEGEAKGIDSGKLVSKVVVKILHEDATSADQMFFLEEVKPYRDLRHPNVLRLLGRCLETGPFLVLLESCSSGNLKSFLCQNISSAGALSQQGVILSMACGVTSGLQHMLENGFVHTDLAARNCLVAADLTVKVGDYGTGIETFKDEYYCAGDMALPIRWCAPETLHCTDTIIETKEVTASANVWSLAVVLWELCEFGSLPYSDCSDEQVIQYVLTSGSKRLPPPSRTEQPHAHNLYHLMRLCWNEAEKRPPISRISSMLSHLYQHCHSPAHHNNNNNGASSLDDFERRWEMSKPNTIPKCDHATLPSSKCSEESVQQTAPLDWQVTQPTPDLDSWLRGMDTCTEEDISEAIRDLDDALAQERTSSSASSQGSSANHTPSRKGLDFRLGPDVKDDTGSRRVESSGSDSEDETWRIRIEKGEFSEKVKEKSKSVADLMILTHIDDSDNSDSDQDADGKRKSLGYGSDGNIHGAVLGEELRETIRRLHESWRDESRLEVIADASLPPASLEDNFLGKTASDTSRKRISSESSVEEAAVSIIDTSRKRISSESSVEEAAVSIILGPSEDFTLDYFRGLKTVYAEPEETWDKLLKNYPSFSQSEPSSPVRGASAEESSPAIVEGCLRNSLTEEHIEEHDSIYGSMKLSDFKVSDEEDFDPTKNHTPDDERSSDSGFRDKGSLSESCEDACDEKYEEVFSRNEDMKSEDESSGWFLHPQRPTDAFTLNEEFANAIRNELRDKLNAFQQELSDEESISDIESEEEKERTNIVIQYKAYSAPLSPIQEESLICSPYNGDKSFSESEPLSSVASNLEDDERKALSECDGTSVAEDDPDTLPLDSDSLNAAPNHVEYPDLDDDDVLLVNTETNEVTLLDKVELQQAKLARPQKPAFDDSVMTPDSISPDVWSPVKNLSVANNEILNDLESCGLFPSPKYFQVKNFLQSESDDTILNLAPLEESVANPAPSPAPTSIKRESPPLESEQLFQPLELKVLSKRICDAQIKYYAKNRLANENSQENSFQEDVENVADDQLMTTSFMVDDCDRPYHLDWESDGDDANSSSSGEFIWKDGDKESSVKVGTASPDSDLQSCDLSVAGYRMSSIVEENEDGESSDGGDSESETEFVPSAWNSDATPKQSALRAPDKIQQDQKKSVSFKRQRYHCVYEYPREVCENEGADYDFIFQDEMFWGGEEGMPPIHQHPPADVFTHLYNSSSPDTFSCQDWSDNMSEDDEFFISSSARPFDYIGIGSGGERGGDVVGQGGSEFFPGRNLLSSDDCEDADGSISESDPEMVTASEHSVLQKSGEDSSSDAYRSLPSNDSTDATEADGDSPPSPLSPVCLLGELRHTRDRLKLDFLFEAPPSNKRSVEQVKGEASLLDGDEVDGEDVDDSGIDSGNSRTLDFHSRPERPVELTT